LAQPVTHFSFIENDLHLKLDSTFSLIPAQGKFIIQRIFLVAEIRFIRLREETNTVELCKGA
jgi:hypothetical protein